ncbi:MAG: Smr/MutS family protein [Treponema sp.]|nr:Smr/MutS family protein [Treponema sp.]
MDFGEILRQWDNLQQSTAHTPVRQETDKDGAAAEKLLSSQRTSDVRSETIGTSVPEAQRRWIDRYGVIDKDGIAAESQAKKQNASPSYIRALKPDATLDLHGCTAEEAWRALERFIADCAQHKAHKVLIIHGKGIHTAGSDPVLGTLVRQFIEHDPRLGASGHPDRKQGGSGATWVMLKAHVSGAPS